MRRRWRIIAALFVGTVIGGASVGAVWYWTRDGDTPAKLPVLAQPSGWDAERIVAERSAIKGDNNSQCALAANPEHTRERIICVARRLYYCYQPDEAHSKDDPDGWSQLTWPGEGVYSNGIPFNAPPTPIEHPLDCTKARGALVRAGLIPDL